jgi:hypothetical protein
MQCLQHSLLVLLLCLQMATAPQVIEFFMTLFCNTTRIVLLMERVPWRLLVQVRCNTWSSTTPAVHSLQRLVQICWHTSP